MKRFSILLMVLFIISVSVGATGNDINLYLESSSTSVKPGENITVTMNVTGGEIQGGKYFVTYPSDILSYVSATSTGTLIVNPNQSGRVIVMLSNTVSITNPLVSLVFKVNENTSGLASIGFSAEYINIGDGSEKETGYVCSGVDVKIKSFTTTTTISETTDTFGVSVDVTDCPEAATLWVACYDEQTLVTCGSATVAAGTSTVSFNIPAASYTKVKTFVWDASLKPLKGVEEN
ncbi:MAG: hypothetical protein IKW64_04705 [Clostridia bacterium]|nr:hypothetical protein [Clostridia bacterium]